MPPFDNTNNTGVWITTGSTTADRPSNRAGDWTFSPTMTIRETDLPEDTPAILDSHPRREQRAREHHPVNDIYEEGIDTSFSELKE